MTHATATGARTVLEGMYAAEATYLAAGGPGQASFDLLVPFFHTDVRLHQADALPYGGTWCGHDGMERFFLAMAQTWASFVMVDQEFLVDDGPAVIRTQVDATARATGRSLSFPIQQTVAVRDGRIIEVRPFYWDTAAIAAACAPV
jgi:ketosteroid isomerase-like protein